MNRRDIELLSSYLDGQLKQSDSARREARLSSDPNLRAVLDDLRGARRLLRQLPMRKAPRNFSLTPQMVGKNPPLPRAYPTFRFVSALATVLLFLTFGVNFLVPQMAASQTQNFGYGGGGAPDTFSAQAPAPAATQAPALEAASAAPATEAPATQAPAEPAIGAAPLSTATLSVQDATRNALTEAPFEKNGLHGQAGVQSQPQVRAPIPPIWQMLLAGIALLSAFMMLMMRRLAVDRWRRK